MNDELAATADLLEQPDNDYDESELLGLLGAMLDGQVVKFDYRGISVTTLDEGRTFRVMDPTEGEVHGEMLTKGSPLQGLLDWVEAKADLYGEAA